MASTSSSTRTTRWRLAKTPPGMPAIHTYPLPPMCNLTVGFAGGVDVRLEHRTVQELHATIRRFPRNSDWGTNSIAPYLTAIHPTKVNGEAVQIRRDVTLRINDIITFGRSTMQYIVIADVSVARSKPALTVAAAVTSSEVAAALAAKRPAVVSISPFPLSQKTWKQKKHAVDSTEKFLAVARRLEVLITPPERLYFRTAGEHMALVCPMLALDVLSRLPKEIAMLGEGSASLRDILSQEVDEYSLTPMPANAAPRIEENVDRTAPANVLVRDDLDLGWSESESDEEGEPNREEPPAVNGVHDESDRSLPAPAAPSSGIVDIIAQHMQFVASLRILTEELSTLASGYEVDGGQLRYQLFHWLEKEVNVLKRLCDYRTSEPEEHHVDEHIEEHVEDENSPSALHEVISKDRALMAARYKIAMHMRKWLVSNQKLLRSFTSFCALHSAQNHRLTSALSSIDQMHHLLAIADTLSHFSADVMDKLAQANAAMNPVAHSVLGESGGYATATAGVETIDECGLRFLMAMKQHEYLLLCLPIKQRQQLRIKGLSSAHVIWAAHSDTENELLNAVPAMQKTNIAWDDLRGIGAAWWLSNHASLRICVEKLAKSAVQLKQDPMDAALFYLALRKKNVLTHLFKTSFNQQMMDFFQQDFSTDYWKKAAQKNAFVLMSKQRFQHAAAFFLLAGSLKDALQTILAKLNDIQLAMVVLRLYETDTEIYEDLGDDVDCVSETGSMDEEYPLNDDEEPKEYANPMRLALVVQQSLRLKQFLVLSGFALSEIPCISPRVNSVLKMLEMFKRPINGIRCIDAHPSAHYYATGSSDGSIRICEWGVGQPLFIPRHAGQHAKTEISGGAHGDLCTWDLRMGQLKNQIKVFEPLQAVSSLVVDPSNDVIAIGNSEGDIKVYSCEPNPQLMYSLPGEHAAKTGFSFRQVGQTTVTGVQQIYVDQDMRMFSCGADCSLNFRTIPSVYNLI